MKLLWLGPARESIDAYLHTQGDEAMCMEEPLGERSPSVVSNEFLVSFGYRNRVKPEVLARFPQRAVNIHISYLPWNRGADPNFWSFAEDTPKGVSIHRMSDALDAGEILCQRELPLGADETLRTSYDKLILAAEDLFCEHWPAIKAGKQRAHPQKTGGSFHRRQDIEAYRHLLRQGWDTPVCGIVGKALTAKRKY